MRIGLTVKISLTIVLILVFALSLNVLLNYFNFNNTYNGLVVSRYGVIGRDLRNSIERAMNLGLELKSIQGIPRLIREKKNAAEGIVFIRIFDSKGRILFDTNPKMPGRNVPDSWRDWLLNTPNIERAGPRDLEHPLALAIGYPLLNSFHARGGGLAIGYSRGSVTKIIEEMLLYLGRNLILYSSLFAFLSFAGVYYIMRGPIADFRSINSALRTEENIEDGFVSSVGEDLQESVNSFRNKTRAMEAEMDALEKEIAELEEGSERA